MVSFALSEEQEAIRKLARDFARKEIIPVAAEYDRTADFPWPIVRKAFELGFWNMTIPEEWGGQGAEHLTEVVVDEEIAYGCLGVFGAFGGTSLAITPLVLFGTPEQKERHLRWFCEAPRLAGFCLTEPNAGSDAGAIATTARRDGDAYILNGAKCFITHGGIADLYVVFASVDRSRGVKGITAFLVRAGTPGLKTGKKEDKMGDRASHIGEVLLEDVRVPLEDRLGEEGGGYRIAMVTLDYARPGIGAAAVGLARRAMEEAVRYAGQRVQFGKPIAALQAIQFMLADMAIGIEGARYLVWRAAWLIDQGKPNAMASAIAKCQAGDVAMKVAVDALQVFGGYGYMKEYPMEKLLRDAKITQIYEGTNQIQRLVIAKELLS